MKKIICTIIAIAVSISCVYFVCKSILSKNQLEDNSKIFDNSEASDNTKLIDSIQLNENENTRENLSNKDEEMLTIYDIEEGYLKVAYNKQADRHEYNWANCLRKENNFYYYEDEKYKSKLGLDLSSYQQDVEWEKIKSLGIEFVILRVGYRGYGKAGNIVMDSMFEEHYRNAVSMGMDVGVYFFSQATNDEEVKEEAELVLESIRDKKISLPVFFDLEKIKNDTARTDNLTLDEINKMSLEFCEIIKENGYTPGIYGNSKTFTTKMKLEEFNNYFKWYADYLETPMYPYEFGMWQYTETGNIDGIEGNVDFNIYFEEK